MDQVLRDLPFAYIYIDGVLVASTNREEHLSHLRQVLTRFTEHGIIIILLSVSSGYLKLLGHLVADIASYIKHPFTIYLHLL